MRLLRGIQLDGLTTCFLALLWLVPIQLGARTEQPVGTVDLTGFIAKSPAILRGVVRAVSIVPGSSLPLTAVAQLDVERWYRGGGAMDATVHYQAGFRIPGHGCIDLIPGTRWLIFATERNGHLEFVDDCYGAVPVSPLMAAPSQLPDIPAQMEADFTAGLSDSDHAGRVVSIQRLGGLKSPSSRPALHGVIEHGDSAERQWAVYAALRSGDTSVLSSVLDLFTQEDTEVPSFYLAWELANLRDSAAVPGLVELTSSPNSNARKYALSAIEKLQASEALPAIAARLADRDDGVRLYALNAMTALTHDPACTLPSEPRWTQDMIEPKVRECQAWWDGIGKQRSPPKR
jgi:hypothetical protein